MSVLVIAELVKGSYKKSSLEAISYGSQIAAQSGQKTIVLAIGESESSKLTSAGEYGGSHVVHVNNGAFNIPDSAAYAALIAAVANENQSKLIIFSHDNMGRAVAPRVSARLKAGLVSGAIALPEMSSGFVVRKDVFSGKAYTDININTDIKVISLLPNSVAPVKTGGSATSEAYAGSLDAFMPKTTSQFSRTENEGEIPLGDAELVVSAGRGMKGPENWGMIEELAHVLGAATACTRPVADIGWRPHHEHVGQTGAAIRPNLYIAIGISGAIQHLAGVNGSKVIVVINKDPEAPFFKAADYGIVGDAFEIVPKLIDAFKKYKSLN